MHHAPVFAHDVFEPGQHEIGWHAEWRAPRGRRLVADFGQARRRAPADFENRITSPLSETRRGHCGGFFISAGVFEGFSGGKSQTNMNTEPAPHHPPPRTLIVAAFAAVYVIWGSTYLAIRVAVETLPPLLMAGCRFLLAGTVLLIGLRLRGTPIPEARHWRNAAMVGTMLLLGGNGLVVWAEQTVTSSLAALIIAITPVWFALLDWARPHGTRPQWQTVIGIVVGFAGVTLLVGNRNGATESGAVSLLGALALVGAGISWAAGSLYARHSPKPGSPWITAALQMICGGSALLLASLLAGEPARANWGHVSVRSVLAFFYLVVFGSWMGFSAYVWLLKVSTPARVATYAYVNPVVAMFLGWLLLGEPVTSRTLCAATVIVVGVVIITLPKEVVNTLLLRNNSPAAEPAED